MEMARRVPYSSSGYTYRNTCMVSGCGATAGAGRCHIQTGFTPIPGTPELRPHCLGETRDVYLRGRWSTIVNLLGRDSSPDARSNPMSKRPLFTTFAVKWASADNGYYVKKSEIPRSPSVSPISQSSNFSCFEGLRSCL